MLSIAEELCKRLEEEATLAAQVTANLKFGIIIKIQVTSQNHNRNTSYKLKLQPKYKLK
jgi:hypothetical protein